MRRPCLLCCTRDAAPGSLLCAECALSCKKARQWFPAWRIRGGPSEYTLMQMRKAYQAWVRIWEETPKGERT